MRPYRLLHVEDSSDDAELLAYALEKASFAFTITRVETEAQYLEQLDSSPPDAILCDYALPEFSAERALEIIRERSLDMPFIIVSQHIGDTAAVVAMQHGASDYLPKRDLGRLPKAIEMAIDRANTRREKTRAQEALRESEAIRRGMLDSLLSRIALVDGSGTIMIVNKAWGAADNVGVDYLGALAQAEERGDAFAQPLAEGLRAVIAREIPVFSIEYESRTPTGTRWFLARTMPLEGSDHAAIVSHRDVTDGMLSHVALRDANDRLQAISKRMLAIQEEERRAISRELHDDIGQTLGALTIGLHRLGTVPAAEQAALREECLAAAAEALDKLRRLALDLRPPQLDQLGLEDALGWLAQRQTAASGQKITCRFAGLESRPPPSIEIACYRIVQEALGNATRHAQAAEITISIDSDGALLKLAVHDDGIGFDAEAARQRVLRAGNMGLIGMEERAQLAGGRLKVRSVRGAGTTVSAIFPLLARVRDEADAISSEALP